MQVNNWTIQRGRYNPHNKYTYHQTVERFPITGDVPKSQTVRDVLEGQALVDLPPDLNQKERVLQYMLTVEAKKKAISGI